ncbi:hypothetical protein GQ457_04G012640 [Hibiscus cannabinus]
MEANPRKSVREHSLGGRPPDVVIPDSVLDLVELLGSPIPLGLQHESKRGRVEDDSMVYMESGVMQDVADMGSGESDTQGGAVGQPSFKETLLGTQKIGEEIPSITELDVEVKDEDVRIGGGSDLPEIWFSDRVHNAIDAKLAKSMIVRLLGKTIGYRALWNRIHSLWSPTGEISLIDLDNDYEGHLSHIMVWVRLPNLPYRYYTKSLFRYIASAIGDVVKVDYNTAEGKRGRFARLAIVVDLNKPLVSGIVIDGKRQDIVYEGLPLICFSCGKYGHMKEACGGADVRSETTISSADQRDPKELYGPWMQVVNRRRRNSTVVRGVVHENPKAMDNYGSRFAALSEVNETNNVQDDVHIDVGATGDEAGLAVPETINNRERVDGVRRTVSKEGSNSDHHQVSRKGLKGVVDGDREKDMVAGVKSGGDMVSTGDNRTVGVEVAARGTVTAAFSSLNAKNHKAITMMKNAGGRVLHGGKGRILPTSIKGTQFKSGVRLRVGESSGPRPKKGVKGMIGSAKSGQFGPLIRELEVVDTSMDEQHKTMKDSSDTSVTRLDWHTNSVFEQPSDTVMQFLLRNKRPDIVAIFEPRISGLAAYRFIRKSSFDSSYRVEAQGFSGGIWLIWRKTVRVDVLAVSSQFVHTICYSLEDGKCFYGSFVYASPNSLRRKDLWAQLLAVDPSNNFPWVVGGDLNVIGSSDERAGGSLRRIGVCRQFHGFLIDFSLVDMRFIGPSFTWRRGTLFQRLDRCLCNPNFYDTFSTSEVHHLVMTGSDHRPIMLDTQGFQTSSGVRPFRYMVAWNEHPDFAKFLKSVWNGDTSLVEKINQFQERSRGWSMDVFGHIGKRKNALLARLRGIDKALEQEFCPSLVRLEAKLKRELDKVLAQEESMWLQRSRVNWISEGDRNTSYYHMATRVRREHNKVRLLKVDNGEWCDDPFLLQQHATHFFRSLFTSEPRSCSRLWKGLCVIWEDLKECIYWDIRNGQTTNFWYDHWLGSEGRLAFSCLLDSAPRPLMVTDMVTDSGTWDWHRLQCLLPMESLERIAGIHPPCTELGDDLPRWRWKINGQFSTRLAYTFLHSEMDVRQNTIWSKVRRHCAASELCEVCHGGPENIEHVLRSCLAAKGVWGKIIPQEYHAVFYTIPIHEWLTGNMFDTPRDISDANWSIRFIILCWMIWKRRCSFVLASEVRRMEDILTSGNRLVEECRRAFDGQTASSVTPTSANSWSCPSVDWVKINVDATVSTLDCTEAIGALWAIHDGLLHAWSRGFRRIEIESDNLEAVRIVTSVSTAVADRLAAKGRWLSHEPTVFLTALDDVINLVEDDKVLSNLVRLPLGHVGVPFDPGGN